MTVEKAISIIDESFIISASTENYKTSIPEASETFKTLLKHPLHPDLFVKKTIPLLPDIDSWPDK